MASKTVLITGATSGIGYELVKLFAKDGYRLVLVARREDELKRIAAELGNAYKAETHIIVADLSKPTAVDAVVAELTKQQVEIDELVNNAGFGLVGSFAETDWAKEAEMIQVNIVALVHLTKRLLPDMISRRQGRILNVASTAAFQPGPLMAVYYATKAFVLSFSEALASELEGTGVTVTALCPGPTQTGFQARASDRPIPLFRRPMAAEAVAKLGYDAFRQGKPVVVTGFMNTLGTYAVRYLPRRFVLSAIKRVQR